MSQKQYIYYTGVGAKPNGIHSVEEFIKIANKEFKMGCSQYLMDQYKPCVYNIEKWMAKMHENVD